VERLEELLASRERVAGWYAERLEHLVLTPTAADGDRHGWQAYVVQLDRRDEALAGLRAEDLHLNLIVKEIFTLLPEVRSLRIAIYLPCCPSTKG
jgi:dTDP-4-amino-4,6-dideoxygalactose transaminase